MILIVGLGNPGEKYARNRHNVGMMFLDFLCHFGTPTLSRGDRISQKRDPIAALQDDNNMKFKNEKHLDSEICKIIINNEEIILTKPQLFMNQSGLAVKSVLKCYMLHVTSFMYIVHDDLDLKLGDYKIQFAKGPKLHNGIESIEKSLRTKDFWRIRIGVDNRSKENRIDGEKYVLQNFNKQEIVILNDVFKKFLSELKLEETI